MFDQITETRIADGKAQVRTLFDEGDLAAMEFAEACEALVAAEPGIRFGLAFCEASGKCLVRWSGTDPGMTELAKKNATAIGAGHSFSSSWATASSR